jgi:hypothetical protein
MQGVAMTFPPRWYLRRFEGASFVVAFSALMSFASSKTTLNQVVNNTTSIVVEAVKRDKTGYTLVLRNTSTRDISSVAVSVTSATGVCDLHALWPTAGRAFIRANQEREIHLPFPRSKPTWSGFGEESCSAAADIIGRAAVDTSWICDHCGGFWRRQLRRRAGNVRDDGGRPLRRREAVPANCHSGGRGNKKRRTRRLG